MLYEQLEQMPFVHYAATPQTFDLQLYYFLLVG
jgi:hypothetical protein